MRTQTITANTCSHVTSPYASAPTAHAGLRDGIKQSDEGLLPWSWAEERLTTSRNYWVTTLWPDGRPHSMPVWGVWDGEALWFSSGRRSRKARNLAADPRCVVTTENADEPVVVRPRWAFGIAHDDFTSSPTRWDFD